MVTLTYFLYYNESVGDGPICIWTFFYYKAAVLIHAERILKWAKSSHNPALTPGSKHAILPVAEFC